MPKRKQSEDATAHGANDVVSNDDANGPNSSSVIPIFLKKTYRMIETCDPSICSWTSDGEMFVVKNPELFASNIIPQYFDHNKFSSFARQLNFYGFRKIQTKPIRNEDFDKSTAKHVTFFNDKFRRGRYDLLKDIQRSTRGGGAQTSLADQARDMDSMRSTVVTLENRVEELETRWQELQMKMEREIQAKVEIAVMDLLSSRPQQHSTSALQAQYMGMPQLPTSFGDASILQRAERSFGSIGRNPNNGQWENPLLGPQATRAFSTASAGSGSHQQASEAQAKSPRSAPTLPPHPKQKSLPPPPVSTRSGIPRCLSGGHQNSQNVTSNGQGLTATNQSLLLRNAWEDKFFSTLMMTDGASRAASLAGLANGMNASGIGGGNVSGLAALAAAQQMQNQYNKTGHQHAAAYQAQQRAVNLGRNNMAAEQPKREATLKRQTTAEVLLEAAGELGKGSTRVTEGV